MVKKYKRKSLKDEYDDDMELPDEVFLALTDFESEAGEVQEYTDTSYTSDSGDSHHVQEPEPNREKVRKPAQELPQQYTGVSSDYSEWPEELLSEETRAEQRRTKKKKKDKKKKPQMEMPRFDKPKNWKAMSKKQRDVWLLEKMEEYKAEKEAEKQAALAGVKERRAAETRGRAETAARDDAEHAVRCDLLARTVALFHKYEKQQVELNHKKLLDAEWQQYLRCDGLPDPRAPAQVNTYLHVWRKRASCDDHELDRRCSEVLPMLDMLEEFVADTQQFTPRQIRNYNEVRLELRKQLSTAIQCASYTLLRDIEHRLRWESIQVASYQRQFLGLKLNIYVAVPPPTRKPKPVEPERDAIELSLPSMAATVRLPRAVNGARACVYAAHAALDLLSETCRTHALPATPVDRYIDLFTFNQKEHENVCQMKKEQDEIRNTFYRNARERVKEIEAYIKANPYAKNDKEKEEMETLILSEPADMPDPRLHIAEQNDMEFSKYLKSCTMKTRTGEINLRKYRICNGVLNLELLVTPPQPKRMAGEIAITTLELPKRLQHLQYEVRYRAPSPPPPGVTRTPEEIEAEIKRTEAEYDKLAMVFIELPHTVMWSEPPVVCQWQRETRAWTCHFINDYKFNEDKLTVQFRTGVLWPIGIATLRYGNMPYQGWDIKPDTDSKGVLICVTGVCETVTWLCVGSSVRLRAVANATTPALQDHFDRPYSVKRMMQIMREAACDFFPDFDGHNYVEGSCPKEWAAERHNYHAMAFLSRAYNFQWSRWNVAAGSRNIVMQIREAVDRKREAKFQVLHVTPQRATILKCVEVSQEYSAEPLPGLEFYPDLFGLNLKYGSADARRATFTAGARLVETVFDMLQELKLSSYS